MLKLMVATAEWMGEAAGTTHMAAETMDGAAETPGHIEMASQLSVPRFEGAEGTGDC